MKRGRNADFLVEIGTEELPPKALKSLMLAFADGLCAALDGERLAHGDAQAFASPRRLAVRVAALAAAQDDRDVEQKGPPVRVAFDKGGKPTQAAIAFAEKCGVAVQELQREQTAKGEWLVHRAVEAGRPAAEVLPGCVQRALDGLPIPRRMRWGAGDAEFVRPVHWVVMLHGKNIVDGRVLGVAAGRETCGHRFMAPAALVLKDAGNYPEILEARGKVLADFAARRALVVSAVNRAAADAGGTAVVSEELFDEVAALTEWPVAITGHFDEEFLALPREVIVATLTGHQRYFPVAGEDGTLLPLFVTVANIESRDPERVRDGNERVIRPRLADAAFFWKTDRQAALAARADALADVVYQQGLGTLADRARRIALLAARIAVAMDHDPRTAERAALLAKCDLLTGMVGEFPELQGIMGRYYALADHEPSAVAEAIAEQYLPRFAGDLLPTTAAGQALAIADKLDTLCGVFALGKKPSGNRDPFGLRRAALGIVRIVVECGIDLDLPELIAASLSAQPASAAGDVADEIYEFIVERQRGWCMERGTISSEMFDAVRVRRLPSLADIDARLQAVAGFVQNDAAESLAAANKRIANILRQAEHEAVVKPDTALFDSDAERSLHESLSAASKDVAALVAERRYADALTRLAELRDPVDRFFDDVMVMADDEATRNNRLALLSTLRAQFLNVADISRLSIGRG